MTAIQQMLLAGFGLALVLGAAAQRSQFCLQGGLREAFSGSGDRRRLAAYGLAMAAAILLTVTVSWILGAPIDPTRPAVTSPVIQWGRLAVGGLLFGTGMMLARGCPLRMLVRTASGSLESALLLVAMAAAAYAMSRTELYGRVVHPLIGRWIVDLGRYGIAHQDLGSLLGVATPGARAVVAVTTALLIGAASVRARIARRDAVAALLIGATVAGAYWVTAGPVGQGAADEASFLDLPPDGLGVQAFSFAGSLGDAIHFLISPSWQRLGFGVIALFGAFAGAAAAALVGGRFRWVPTAIDSRLAMRMAGALLAGSGAVIGFGCSIGHGLSGLAVLSAGSSLGLVSILIGAWMILRLERVFASDENGGP